MSIVKANVNLSPTDPRAPKNANWLPAGPNTFVAGTYLLPELEAGLYMPTQVGQSFGVRRMPVIVDELLNLPNSLSEKVLADIDNFWKVGDRFTERGFLHRRGFLFHGPPGSGKTALVQQIVHQLTAKNGVVLNCSTNPGIVTAVLNIIRQIEPNRPIVCLFEDIDTIIANYGEHLILSLLDGENQINKVLNIATTNYPERLPPRLTNRPKRFDQVLEVGWPGAEIRGYYFKYKLGIKDDELKKWVDATDKFSFAACADLVISVKCLDKEFDEAVGILRNMNTNRINSKNYDVGAEPVSDPEGQ